MMISFNGSVIFENEADFESVCHRNPYTGVYNYNHCVIKKPTHFPAAFQADVDYDPRCCGSYIEGNFCKIVKDMIRDIDEDIRCLQDKREYIASSILRNS